MNPLLDNAISALVRPVPVAITIAGSDSGGGAGVQTDLLAFSAHGVHGTCAITCLTAQNPAGVSGIYPVSPEFVQEQALQIARFFNIAALKTGMLFNAPIIAAVAEFVRQQREKNARVPLVLDPVMVATSGARLLEDNAITALATELIPLATLITPNLDEAAVLLNRPRPSSRSQMIVVAQELHEKFGCAVFLKGGHLNTKQLTDVFVDETGAMSRLVARRCVHIDTHGSGCTLAAAIAARLARDESLTDAVDIAHAYLQAGIRSPVHIGGHDFIDRFPDLV
ncbi:MAG: bifunctional hydroxymethylpyrimidine kinase/phosphomethylpyrimidine kinase [Puniceicoccales bacterium]|jgi:hydroxymethylpyrimidine/phosphomethylpyrimidine kinase|nr:bifunctional hydroxymethylpyrimidine kinase/phosphomethylpyrimidine kinase [Puniceicoccales bacterium]